MRHHVLSGFLIHNTWTLEDFVPLKRMVCDVLRPMLKVWLDDNLPAMVERLIRTEIERRRSFSGSPRVGTVHCHY